MGKVSKISMKSGISENDMEDFDKMVEDSLSVPLGNTEYSNDNKENEIEAETCKKSELKLSETKNKTKTTKTDGKNIDFDKKSFEDRLNDIYNEFLEDATITIANIKDRAFREAAIKGRWCSRLMAEKVKGKRLKQSLEKLINDIKSMANSKKDADSYLMAKYNVDSIVNSNKEVISLRNEIYESRETEEFLSQLYDCIKGLGYTIKNSLDVLNLEMGI